MGQDGSPFAGRLFERGATHDDLTDDLTGDKVTTHHTGPSTAPRSRPSLPRRPEGVR